MHICSLIDDNNDGSSLGNDVSSRSDKGQTPYSVVVNSAQVDSVLKIVDDGGILSRDRSVGSAVDK